ncbi:inosine-uridine preferring nucleoside hydrolase [Grosmannia clavigera kw1407]|uniref:Inosine-uridine preferring nucleoside hydrolase n=1 Tax=Grosmannia clavigera (strain kw1407 / UAMH 11150) TaxID=655863 RepID=F0XDZ1_GROCL|nr:inosine-uridine preferring nucleoside hydrolase [Grosmannia clavigera kw1407]EFX04147.1 inosine-uridine preferring nucleoside hydrolase [Grosmannia clavigera kw1407]
MILETANVVQKSGKKLTILCLGPLTNLALATMKDPTLSQKLDRAFGFYVTGTTRSTGDILASEWNIYVDPEAASLVFGTVLDLYALGLDVATRPDVEFSAEHFQKLRIPEETNKPEARFLLGVIQAASNVDARGFLDLLIDTIC